MLTASHTDIHIMTSEQFLNLSLKKLSKVASIRFRLLLPDQKKSIKSKSKSKSNLEILIDDLASLQRCVPKIQELPNLQQLNISEFFLTEDNILKNALEDTLKDIYKKLSKLSRLNTLKLSHNNIFNVE